MFEIKNLGKEKRFWKKAYWTDPIVMPFWAYAVAVLFPLVLVWSVALLAR